VVLWGMHEVRTMSDRICAECGSGIVALPQVYFCDKQCCLSYLQDHDTTPDEYVTRDDQ